MFKAVVDDALRAEGADDRQLVRGGEGPDVVRRRRRPAGAADDQERPLGLLQQFLQLGEIVGTRRGAFQRNRRDVGRVAQFVEDILGDGQHHGTGAAAGGDMEGLGDHFGDRRRVGDFGGPFGHAAEHGFVVHFLEGFAAALGARHLSDEQHEAGRVLLRRMQADGGMHGAGTAADHADARTAAHSAVGFRHVGGARLVAAGDELDAVGGTE